MNNLYGSIRRIVDKTNESGLNASAIYVAPMPKIPDKSAMELFLLAKADERFTDLGVNWFDGGPFEFLDVCKQFNDMALILIDDFAGSGDQFRGEYRNWKQVTEANNRCSCYFTPSIMCREAGDVIERCAVIAEPGYIHEQAERFQDHCLSELGMSGKQVIESYARELTGKGYLGHKSAGAMVVIYRNSFNNMPRLLRGTKGQRVWRGVFPRRDELEPELTHGD